MKTNQPSLSLDSFDMLINAIILYIFFSGLLKFLTSLSFFFLINCFTYIHISWSSCMHEYHSIDWNMCYTCKRSVFSITPVGGHEAVWFSLDWKVPCVLYWEEHSGREGAPTPSTPPLPYSPDLFVDAAKCSTITPLGPHEIPQPGN